MFDIPRVSRRLLFVAILTVPLVLSYSCDEAESPELPTGITLYSGDGQFSKIGTVLPNPLEVLVRFSDGTPAGGVTVHFRVVTGTGQLSPVNAVANSRGIASTSFTLGDEVGAYRIRATLSIDNTKFVEFDATAGEYYCQEEDPTFSRKFNDRGNLFLLTRKSRLNEQGAETVSGIVKIQTDFINDDFHASSVKKFDEGQTITVVRDAAFSPAGDLYLSWNYLSNEVLKTTSTFSTSHFATLESFMGSEITTTPNGIVVGCDEFGPFVLGCRDTLFRFPEAIYSGSPGDNVNNDAVAVDPNTEDIYFIYLPDATLRCLPVDTLVATDTVQTVAQLTTDEANGANGMVCDVDGTVYILVDTNDTKVLISVTPAGVKTTLYDFFDRGPGDDAGVQNDLAIWQLNQNEALLYTVDTYNDVLLIYRTLEQVLVEMPPDTLAGNDPESLSTTSSFGERVGLVVLP